MKVVAPIAGESVVGLALTAATVGIIAYVGYRLLKGAGDIVPQKVKEGVEAAGQLFQHGAHMVTAPLDAFGIVPGTDEAGVAMWERSAPWVDQVPFGGNSASSNDIVSNNSDGINYNYF